MTSLQKIFLSLFVASVVFFTPLIAQEATTQALSSTPVQEEAKTEKETQTSNSPSEEAAQSETKDVTQEGAAETEAQDISQATDRPPRKELDIHTPEHIHIQK